MDTDVRTVALVNGAPIPAIPLRTASAPPPNDTALRHWRDRARAAEARVEALEQVLGETIEEMDRYVPDLAGIEDEVGRCEAWCEAWCAALWVENAELRSDRWFRRTIVGLATLLLGYAVGVLMR